MAGHDIQRHNAALAGSAFAIGIVAGLFLKRAVHRVRELTRRRRAHVAQEDTVVYDENLPDTLERREPGPHSGQPRFGGTGALGVSPAAAEATRRTN